LDKARERISAARVLLQQGFPDDAVSRSYYAMFYVASAFLESKGLRFSKHSAVIGAFGEQFAKTGELPADFHRFLIDAQDLRQDSDYGLDSAFSTEDVEELLRQAEQFVKLAEERLTG
jgi:uncharacterized protein (UPF0332 family)